jgi:thiol:disulfide interchange protein DsbA
MPRLIIALILGLLALPALAQSVFIEGEHYRPLQTAQATGTDKVQVLEFFSYGCSHCFEFEETLEPWVQALPDHVEFERSPAGLGRRFFQLMAVSFHVADFLGVQAEMHPVLFDEIHNKKNNALGSMGGLSAVFNQGAGVDSTRFAEAMNSQVVMEAFKVTEARQANYELHGVPMLVVNGKFAITRNQQVNSYEMMLEVANYLIEKEK